MRIFLIDIDCLRPDHIGAYGYNRPTTPNIDAIAHEGVRFSNYHCADSPCLPSRMAFFSGRFGIHNGIVSNHDAGARFHIPLRPYGGPQPDYEMLIRQMRKHGYDSYSFTTFADRHNAMWFVNGWTEFHMTNLMCGFETAEQVNDRVIPWLRNNAGRDNYICHINYWDAHRTYRMDPSWADRFANHPVTQPWPDEDAIARHQELTAWFTATRQFPDSETPPPLMPRAIRNRADFEKMLTGYDASIAYVDHHLGQVFQELDRQGVLDDAVIIITADHGDAFGEHGIYTDHVSADSCINRIPLIVRWPGVTPPDATDASLLYNIDFSATLLQMIDAPIPAAWDGTSFLSNLKGQTPFQRPFLVYGHALYTVQRVVRTPRYAMARTYDHQNYPSFLPLELHDLQNDLFQTHNLAPERPDLVAEHDRLLNDWLQEQRMKNTILPDPFDLVLQERANGLRR